MNRDIAESAVETIEQFIVAVIRRQSLPSAATDLARDAQDSVDLAKGMLVEWLLDRQDA